MPQQRDKRTHKVRRRYSLWRYSYNNAALNLAGACKYPCDRIVLSLLPLVHVNCSKFNYPAAFGARARICRHTKKSWGCIESFARSLALGYHVPNSLHLSCFCSRRERQFQWMQKLLFTTQRDHSFSGSELRAPREGEGDKIYSLAEHCRSGISSHSAYCVFNLICWVQRVRVNRRARCRFHLNGKTVFSAQTPTFTLVFNS